MSSGLRRRRRWTGGALIEPLAPRRYQVRVTVGEEAHAALRQLQDLLSHELPEGDPAAIIERALAALLEQTLARKAAQTRRSRRASTATPSAAPVVEVPAPAPGGEEPVRRSRHVRAAVRRAVWKRDGGRCAHVDDKGRRCTARRFLELHHVEPWARGGAHSSDNLELRCRAHNQYQATLDFGAAFIAARRSPDRASEPVLHPWSCRQSLPIERASQEGAARRGTHLMDAPRRHGGRRGSRRPRSSA